MHVPKRHMQRATPRIAIRSSMWNPAIIVWKVVTSIGAMAAEHPDAAR
jgi:hypothetical protein